MANSPDWLKNNIKYPNKFFLIQYPEEGQGFSPVKDYPAIMIYWPESLIPESLFHRLNSLSEEGDNESMQPGSYCWWSMRGNIHKAITILEENGWTRLHEHN